jgi:hypothetical protein
MNWIIKSGKKNWSGKEFSDHPAKIYPSFDECVSALNSYHFWELNDKKCYVQVEKKERIEFIPLTTNRQFWLLADGKIRW